jgi:hypothetical protein
MTERPRKFEGEDRQTEDLAPENQNFEQDDEGSQAQTFADDALGRSSDDFGLEDSEKVPTGGDGDDVPDLVDHMRQMERSGRIDHDAFRGERSDPDRNPPVRPPPARRSDRLLLRLRPGIDRLRLFLLRRAAVRIPRRADVGADQDQRDPE